MHVEGVTIEGFKKQCIPTATVAALYSRSYTEQNVKARKMQDHDLEIEFLLIHCGAFPTCPVPGLRNPHSQSAVCIALKYWNYDSEF